MAMTRRAFISGAAGVAGVAVAGVRPASGQSAAGAGEVTATRPVYARPIYDAQGFTDALFASVPRRLAFKARNSAELKRWQEALGARLKELLGLTLMAAEVPFEHRATRTERVRLDGYTREKWYLWTEPNVPLPIWVLIPDKPADFGAAGKYPLLLAVHGHNEPEIYLGEGSNDKDRAKIAEGERDIAVQAVKEGYLSILITARGFGETCRPDDRKNKKIHSCRTGLMHGMLFGRTMIGCRVWDTSRVIDWASRQFAVDSARIAITGNSGGGTTSLFAPACEPRIGVAVPSCYFCTFQASIGSIYHCECNYVPGLLREAEMYDVAGLIAPRPFRAIAGQSDPIFPIEAVRDSYRRLREIYRTAGAEDRCELYVGDGGHRYYKAGSWPFIRKWFEAKQ